MFNKSSFIFSLAIKASGPLLGFIILFVISEYYGKYAVGFYTVLIQVLILSSVLIRWGGDFVLIKFSNQLNLKSSLGAFFEIKKSILINAIIFSFVISILLNYFALNGFLQLIHTNQYLFIFSVISFSLFNLVMSFLIAIQKPSDSIFYQSFMFQALVLILYFIMPKEIDSLLVSISLTSTLLLLFIIFRETNIRKTKLAFSSITIPKGRLKGFVFALTEFLIFNSDLIILSLFVSLELVASYALASRLVMMYGFYVQVQNSHLSGKITLISSMPNKSTELVHLFWKTLKQNLLVLLPYILITYIVAHIILNIFGEKYYELFDYFYVLLGIGVVGILIGFSTNFFFLISPENKNFWGTKFGISWSIFFIICLVTASYFFGALGLAYTILVLKVSYYIVFFILSMKYVRKIYT